MEFYRVLLSPFQLREMERSWGSSFLLFPSEPAWKRDEVFAFNAVTNYTLNNVKEFFDDLDFSEGYDHYLESQRNTDLMHNVPDVTTHCIHGSGIETSDVYGWSNGYFPGKSSF
uniref:DDE_Tnp_1_7 domain-containing protein n=1 Tax=Rhabditophanes sp. KR3021 TaxID=114890 RepID=A0AC35U3V3_9BILA